MVWHRYERGAQLYAVRLTLSQYPFGKGVPLRKFTPVYFIRQNYIDLREGVEKDYFVNGNLVKLWR